MHCWQRRLRQTTLLLIGFIAVLAGLGMARTGLKISGRTVLALLPLLLLVLPRRSAFTACLVVLTGLGLGVWRGQSYMQKLHEYDRWYGQKITITAVATNDGVYGQHSQISFDGSRIRAPNGQALAGKVQLSGFGLNTVYQGDVVRATGKLLPSRGSYQGRLGYARLVLVRHQPSVVNDIRRRFTAGMQSALPEPLAPFAMGLLIGQRATLPDSVKQDLTMVGLTHIIAVSGYNLTIMLHASQRLLSKRSKRLQTLLSLSLIGLFLLVAGASASIVRAAIVSVLSIVAAYYGRRYRPLNILALVAMITAWANPFYLWSDVSWYLSFLAFFGVLVVAPLLTVRAPPALRRSLPFAVAIESLSAEIMTLPFILHVFGQISLVGLPANMLVTSLVPLAMLFSMVAGLARMFLANVAGWLSWPAALLLNYMLDVAHILAGLPGIFRQNLSFATLQMLTSYAGILVMCAILQHKTKAAEFAIITDKKPLVRQGATLERTQQMVNN